jgi:hypothetical protein
MENGFIGSAARLTVGYNTAQTAARRCSLAAPLQQAQLHKLNAERSLFIGKPLYTCG